MNSLGNDGRPIEGLRSIRESHELLRELRSAFSRMRECRSQNWIGAELHAWHDIERFCHCLAADARARQLECDGRITRATQGGI